MRCSYRAPPLLHTPELPQAASLRALKRPSALLLSFSSFHLRLSSFRTPSMISRDRSVYMAPDPHPQVLSVCISWGKIPRFQTLKMILAGDCVPFLMKLCCSCGRIVKKMCQKEVKKSCRKKIFCSSWLILVYLLCVVCIQPCDKFIQRRSIYSITRLLCRRRILRLKSVID